MKRSRRDSSWVAGAFGFRADRPALRISQVALPSPSRIRPVQPELPRLPPAFLQGVRLFNGGRYFEAHEAFEELLDGVETDDRWALLVALIQVAVGYHKLATGQPGGSRMLGAALEKLALFPGNAGGVALEKLRARVIADREALDAGVPAARQLVPPPRIVLAVGVNWRDAR